MTYQTLVNESKELLRRLNNFEKNTLVVQRFVVEQIAIETIDGEAVSVVVFSDKSGNNTKISFDDIAEYLDNFDNDWDYDYTLEDYIDNLHQNNHLADVAAMADFWHLEAERMEEAQKWATYQAARFKNIEQQPEQQSLCPDPIEIR